MDELKPCPFCGGDAELLSINNNGQGLSPLFWYVVCTNMCARTFRHISDHDAIEAWNRRVSDDERRSEAISG